MTKKPALNVLALFCRASDGELDERQRCLGQVEKALVVDPLQPGLLGCKAALLVLVAGKSRSAEVNAHYQRVGVQMAEQAWGLMPVTERAELHLINGLAWAQIGQSPEAEEHALHHLTALAQSPQMDRLEPVDQLTAWVALSVIHQEAGRAEDSRVAFVKACAIDRAKAIAGYEQLKLRRAGPPDQRA